jgi:hypothetical protein
MILKRACRYGPVRIMHLAQELGCAALRHDLHTRLALEDKARSPM